MLETIKKYSEETYYRKEDLAKELDSYILETVWSEVEKYRNLFRYDISFQGYKRYLTLNRKVMFELLKTQQLLAKYLDMEKALHTMEATVLEEQGKWGLLFHQCIGANANKNYHWYQDALCMLGVGKSLDLALLQFQVSEDTPLLLSLFLCHCYMEEPMVMSKLLLLEKNALPVFPSLLEITMLSELSKTSENDMTYYFLYFLKQIWLKISDLMVLLTGSLEENLQTLSGEELQARYPQLSSDQIYFYVRHRETAHYYTILNYIEDRGVCYETARYSLEELVTEHWYQKQKIGKKFVYFIN